MQNREQWLADTLVELADTLVADFDLLELLQLLVERCGELLGAGEVGIVLAGQRGQLTVMASSTERMRAMELFEVQNREGPCLDCITTGHAVTVDDLASDAAERWPAFAAKARDAGFSAVLALPMRMRDRTIGAVNVFLGNNEVPSLDDLRLAQALADVATISILQERALSQSTELASQLQRALNSRITLEQAKGMTAEILQLSIDEAFEVLRTYARGSNRTLGDVAGGVVTRTLDPRRFV